MYWIYPPGPAALLSERCGEDVGPQLVELDRGVLSRVVVVGKLCLSEAGNATSGEASCVVVLCHTSHQSYGGERMGFI